MKRKAIGLALLLCASLSGCSGLNSAVKKLQAHPEHCAEAVQQMQRAILAGLVPPDTSPEEMDVLLHRVELILMAADICPP